MRAWWWVIALLFAAPNAGAQPVSAPSRPRVSIGAMRNWAVTSAHGAAEGRTASDLAVNLDVRLTSSTGVRGEFGRSRFTFDGNSGGPAPPPEPITLTRLTATAMRTLDGAGGFYIGLGVGWYRYWSELDPSTTPTRGGLHVVTGTEIAIPAGGLAVRIEAQWQFVRAPHPGNAAEPPSDGTGSATVSRLRIMGNPSNLIWGLGIGWRF